MKKSILLILRAILLAVRDVSEVFTQRDLLILPAILLAACTTTQNHSPTFEKTILKSQTETKAHVLNVLRENYRVATVEENKITTDTFELATGKQTASISKIFLAKPIHETLHPTLLQGTMYIYLEPQTENKTKVTVRALLEVDRHNSGNPLPEKSNGTLEKELLAQF